MASHSWKQPECRSDRGRPIPLAIRMQRIRPLPALIAAACAALGSIQPSRATEHAAEPARDQLRTVKAFVQPRPGKPREEIDMAVHTVPVDLPTVEASKAPLDDDDLVLGVELDGQTVAYPIRFLSMFEVINSRVGKTPVAPSW